VDVTAVVPTDTVEISLTVNGTAVRREVPARQLLVDFLRDGLNLTGTHVGCEHGVCGACTVLIDGRSSRSCTLLAFQADGGTVTTVESLAVAGRLHPLQQSFKRHHALQCGFCTPGFLMTIAAAEPAAHPDDESIRELLAGNLCRCTGYQQIVAAVRDYWGREAR
jgi:carbon-monoxide dehydrogenase small subunit